MSRHACVIPLLLCPMKPCVSKFQTCMQHHFAQKLGMARVVVLVGKDAYKVYFNSGSIPETLYGSSFKDGGKHYFCFSDYLNLAEEDPSQMRWTPPSIVYWEDRLRKEAKAFGEFVRETVISMVEGA